MRSEHREVGLRQAQRTENAQLEVIVRMEDTGKRALVGGRVEWSGMERNACSYGDEPSKCWKETRGAHAGWGEGIILGFRRFLLGPVASYWGLPAAGTCLRLLGKAHTLLPRQACKVCTASIEYACVYSPEHHKMYYSI